MKEQKTNYKIIEVKNCPFNIIEQNEEFFITCGNSVATAKTFKTEEAARKYIFKTDWQMVGTLLINMLNFHDKDKEIEKNMD